MKKISFVCRNSDSVYKIYLSNLALLWYSKMGVLFLVFEKNSATEFGYLIISLVIISLKKCNKTDCPVTFYFKSISILFVIIKKNNVERYFRNYSLGNRFTIKMIN